MLYLISLFFINEPTRIVSLETLYRIKRPASFQLLNIRKLKKCLSQCFLTFCALSEAKGMHLI